MPNKPSLIEKIRGKRTSDIELPAPPAPKSGAIKSALNPYKNMADKVRTFKLPKIGKK